MPPSQACHPEWGGSRHSPCSHSSLSHATSRHLGGLQGPGCHLCMAVIVLCQHPGVMACSEDENPCGRAGAGGKGRDRQGGKGGQEQAGREGRNRQQNQAGACAFKHYSSAAGSQGCLRQTPIYLPSCPRSCQQGSAGGTRSTLPHSALAQACACPTPCCRHWHAPVRRPCHPPCPLPAIRKPLWVSGQHQNLWPGVSRQAGQWFLHQIPTPVPATLFPPAVGAWEGGDGTVLLLSAESGDRAVCASTLLLLLPTSSHVPLQPAPAWLPARAWPLLRDLQPACTQPTHPGSPHLPGLTRTPPARLAAGSCQTAAGSASSQPCTRTVCEHACTHTCSARLRAPHSHTDAPAPAAQRRLLGDCGSHRSGDPRPHGRSRSTARAHSSALLRPDSLSGLPTGPRGIPHSMCTGCDTLPEPRASHGAKLGCSTTSLTCRELRPYCQDLLAGVPVLSDGGTHPAPHCPTASPSPWQGAAGTCTQGTLYPMTHACIIAPITPARWQTQF